MSFLAAVKNFDFNPKIAEDVKKRTLSGGAVSIIGGIFLFWLFVSETSTYLSSETIDHLYVDTSRGEKLRINVDILFPKIPCTLLSLDVMDISGGHQTDVDHNIIKTRIDKKGKIIAETRSAIGDTLKEEHVSSNSTVKDDAGEVQDPNYCGSCYGARPEGQCCNTCQSVREAYHAMKWTFTNPKSIEQCVREGKTGSEELDNGEGCNVRGFLEVNKVAGNFHFAPGRSFQQSHVHVHDMEAFESGAFDVSHTVKRISFGEDFPGIVSPLDGRDKDVPKGGTIVQYYVKVVPTTYSYLDGKTIETNQYSVTDHETTVEEKQGRVLPGVFFFYDISPIMVSFTETRRSFAHYLTQLCAIIGGVFTVIGMIDRLVYSSLRSIGKKVEIGKFG